ATFFVAQSAGSSPLSPYHRSAYDEALSPFHRACCYPSTVLRRPSFVISPTYARMLPPRCRFLRALLRSMDQRNRILIVDDDPKFVDLLRVALERSGYSVVTAPNGLQGEKVFRATPVDLVMLDVMMPQRDGFEMLRDLRAISPVPIIMLTALSDTENVVKGLELGADDYITKPFELKEVLARVHAALARVQRMKGGDKSARVLALGDVSLDLDRGIARVRDSEVPLTPIELELLHYMMMHAGRLLERETLLRDVWGYDYFGKTNLVDVAIRRLREKIEADPSNPVYLLTVRGQGYRFARPS